MTNAYTIHLVNFLGGMGWQSKRRLKGSKLVFVKRDMGQSQTNEQQRHPNQFKTTFLPYRNNEMSSLSFSSGFLASLTDPIRLRIRCYPSFAQWQLAVDVIRKYLNY